MAEQAPRPPGFEIVEHTADVGIKAWAIDVPGVFEQATLGLLEIVGAWRPGEGEPSQLHVEADDLGALLVDWLGEVLWLQDSRDAVVTSVEVASAEAGQAIGELGLAPREGDEPLEGTQVKAITYHRLRVEETSSGWEAEIYVDV